MAGFYSNLNSAVKSMGLHDSLYYFHINAHFDYIIWEFQSFEEIEKQINWLKDMNKQVFEDLLIFKNRCLAIDRMVNCILNFNLYIKGQRIIFLPNHSKISTFYYLLFL